MLLSIKSFFKNLKQPKHKIMMVHPGRCGSTVIGNLLKQHFNIFWAGEIYTADSIKWKQANPDKLLEQMAKEEKYISTKAINLLKNSMGSIKYRHYGFEVLYYQIKLYNCMLTDYMQKIYNLGFERFIMLERKNILRIVVSNHISMLTNKWHNYEVKKAKLTKITISSCNIIKKLVLHKTRIQETEKALMGRNVLKLNYEDDIENDPKKAYLRICDFIGIKPQKVVVDLFKTNPFPLPDIIINFAEIERTLKNTTYEWMLYK